MKIRGVVSVKDTSDVKVIVLTEAIRNIEETVDLLVWFAVIFCLWLV
jgi:hypothetical protein